MKHLRPNAGISNLPNGLKMYQGFLEYHTSKADITPETLRPANSYISGFLKIDVYYSLVNHTLPKYLHCSKKGTY